MTRNAGRSDPPPFIHGPLADPEADALGRRDWTLGVATALAGWNGHEPLCVNIDGAWGSGKSTATLFVLSALRDFRQTPSGSVVVNAWEFDPRGRDERFLHRAMRTAMVSLAGSLLKTKPFLLFRLLPCWLAIRLAQLSLEPVADSTISFLVGLGTVVVTAAGVLVGLGSPAARPAPAQTITQTTNPVPSASLVESLFSREVLLWVLLVSAGVVLVPLVFNLVRRATVFLFAPVSTRLFQCGFSGLPGNLIVVLEDLDRVSAERLENLFRLMQTQFRLPHVIYLLPMARDRVAATLEPVIGEHPDTYLERMVQVALALPPIRKSDVAGALERGIAQILPRRASSSGAEGMVSRSPGAFLEYFSDLRAVNRYLHALSFTAAALVKDDVLEVNDRDLLLVEALRLFEPQVFLALYALKSKFVGPYNMLVFDGNRADVGEALLADANRPISARRIIRSLFAAATRAFPDHNDNYEVNYEPNRALTLEALDVFDRYFLHFSSEVSSRVFDDFILSTRGPQVTVTSIRRGLFKILKLETENKVSRGLLHVALREVDVDNRGLIVRAMAELEFDPDLEPGERIRLGVVLVDFLNWLPDGVDLAVQLFATPLHLSVLHGLLIHPRHGMTTLTVQPVSPDPERMYRKLRQAWVDRYAAEGGFSDAVLNGTFAPVYEHFMREILQGAAQP